VVFSKNVKVEQCAEILRVLKMAEVQHHEKYLGLPMILGITKKSVFASIKERIWKKLQGYKEGLLSNPSKEVILKA